jgi:site-specific DNA recombinase
MRQWQVRRALQPHPDGQRRWDRTYQQLMAWTQTPQSGAVVPAPCLLQRRIVMRIGIYARVSTQRQAQANGLAQQLERLQAHALQQGWSVAAEDIFRDDGYSGASLKRPGLERLRDRAAMRQLDCILITAPDRLARNYVHQVLLLEEISATGCQVQFLDRPMSQDPHDQLLLQIRGAVAEYERSLIAERMRRGRLRKLQAGILLPWTKPPYGYRVDPDHPRDPAGVRQDPTEAAAVAEMFVW